MKTIRLFKNTETGAILEIAESDISYNYNAYGSYSFDKDNKLTDDHEFFTETEDGNFLINKYDLIDGNYSILCSSLREHILDILDLKENEDEFIKITAEQKTRIINLSGYTIESYSDCYYTSEPERFIYDKIEGWVKADIPTEGLVYTFWDGHNWKTINLISFVGYHTDFDEITETLENWGDKIKIYQSEEKLGRQSSFYILDNKLYLKKETRWQGELDTFTEISDISEYFITLSDSDLFKEIFKQEIDEILINLEKYVPQHCKLIYDDKGLRLINDDNNTYHYTQNEFDQFSYARLIELGLDIFNN